LVAAPSLVVASNHRRLRAYQLAAGLAREIRAQVVRWSSFDRDTLGLQLVRAIESVGANIAEAEGRWYPADKRRVLFIARGSLYELEHWLESAKSRGLGGDELSGRIEEAAMALNGLLRRTARL